MPTEPSSRRRRSSGDSRRFVTYGKKDRVAKACARKDSRHGSNVPSTSASIMSTPTIRVTSPSDQSMDAEPTPPPWDHNALTEPAHEWIENESGTKGCESNYDEQVVNTGDSGATAVTSTSDQSMDAKPKPSPWEYNALTKRARELIEKYESGTKGWESNYDQEVVNTGRPARKEEQGFWFCEYATPTGHSSLTIEICELDGTQILSYTAASVSKTRSLRSLKINVPSYKHARFDPEPTVSN